MVKSCASGISRVDWLECRAIQAAAFSAGRDLRQLFQGSLPSIFCGEKSSVPDLSSDASATSMLC